MADYQLQSSKFHKESTFTGTGVIAPVAGHELRGEGILTIIVEDVNATNIVEVQAKLRGATDWQTIASIRGAESISPINILGYDIIRFEVTTYSASTSGTLIASGFFSDPATTPNDMDAYRSSFGDFTSNALEPICQISAQYGLLDNVETFTASGGTATESNSLFTCTTGTTVGAYSVIRSVRPTMYREGQGLMARFTAIFDSTNAVADSLQFAGLFNVQDTLAFGYRGTSFGIIYDSHGAQEAKKLTITVAGNGTLTVTLNSVAYSVPITTGTTAHNAYEIYAWFNNAVNQTVWTTEQVSNTVIFRKNLVGAASGTYSVSGAGLTGSITAVSTGASKTEVTIAQADWNGEKVDFNPAKGNIYMIKVSYLGFGPISFYILNPTTRKFVRVHTLDYPDNYTIPSISNRGLKVGWTAASLGSATSITVKGASAGVFIEGISTLLTPSHANFNTNAAVGTSYVTVLTLKSLLSLNGKANLGRIVLTRLEVTSDSAKNASIKLVKNPTLGETNYSYHEEGKSIAKFGVNAHAESGTEHALYQTLLGSNGSASIDLSKLDIALYSGETLSVFAKVVSGAASSITAALVWKEDL